RRLRPRAVLCVGGYAAGPVSLAAVLAGIPLAVLEPNATMGLANTILTPVARRTYVAWAETARWAPTVALRGLGVPLRAGFSPVPYVPSDTARVLVLGGSQGAQALNERMPEVVERVVQDVPNAFVLHQAGKDRDAEVRAAYRRANVKNVSVVPFVDDVAA